MACIEDLKLGDNSLGCRYRCDGLELLGGIDQNLIAEVQASHVETADVRSYGTNMLSATLDICQCRSFGECPWVVLTGHESRARTSREIYDELRISITDSIYDLFV